MKRLLILLLLLPSLAWGGETQIARMNPYILGGGAAAGFSDYCPGTGLILCESYEKSGGTCGDGSATNCWITWTAKTNWPAWTGSPLDGGSNAITISNTEAVEGITTTFTAANTVYTFFMMKPTAFPTIGTRMFHGIGADRCNIHFTGEGAIRSNDEADWATASSTKMTLNETYYVWAWFKRGASSDAECGACFSSTDTNPGSGDTCSIHTGFTRDVTAASVTFTNGFSGDDSVQLIVDKIKVDDAAITN